MSNTHEPLRLAVEFNEFLNVDFALTKLGEFKCSFVVVPLSDLNDQKMIMPSSSNYTFDWNNVIVAKLSKNEFWKNLEKSLNWASHIWIKYLLLPKIEQNENIVIASSVLSSSICSRKFKGQFWIRFEFNQNGIDQWHKIRRLCPYKKRIFPVVEISTETPFCIEMATKWFAEGIRAVFVDLDCFQSNEFGNLNLSTKFEKIIIFFLKNGVNIVFKNSDQNLAFEKQNLDKNCPSNLHKNNDNSKNYILNENLVKNFNQNLVISKNLTKSPKNNIKNCEKIENNKSPNLIIQKTTEKVKNFGENDEKIQKTMGKVDFCPFLRKIEKIHNENCSLTEHERIITSYRDNLQIPLQPLRDDLNFAIYEEFEKDFSKYNFYQKAIIKAIDDELNDGSVCKILIVGPGRGPLIDACLKAVSVTKVKFKITAIEKNSLVFETLKYHKNKNPSWADIKLINADARSLISPENDLNLAKNTQNLQKNESNLSKKSKKFDLIISELLGSFSDNELCPEILIPLKPLLSERGVMIPRKIRSFLAPVFCPNAWSKIALIDRADMAGEITDFEGSKYEVNYVSNLFRFQMLSMPQKCFEFDFSRDFCGENFLSNFIEINFDINGKSQCYGFSGYFEADLYGNIKISTNPLTKTKQIFSWFPMYFPLMHPFTIFNKLKLNFWRHSNTKKAWYEWCISEPVVSPIHNICGRSYSIKLS